MLLKGEALIVPRWVYAPGRGQIGDGLSRNPEDRDRVRHESEEKSHLPKTLAEAFELVSKCRLSGGLVDDAEAVARALRQLAGNKLQYSPLYPRKWVSQDSYPGRG